MYEYSDTPSNYENTWKIEDRIKQCKLCGALVDGTEITTYDTPGQMNVSRPGLELHDKWHEQLDKASENANYAAGMMRPLA